LPASRYVLGVSAFYHDSAACLLRDGAIVAAAQEERFSRIKGDERFPAAATAYCLSAAGITAAELDAVVFYDKPVLKLDRLLETYLWIAPRGLRSFLKAGPLWASDRLRVERTIRHALDDYRGRVLFCEHHESHAASAYYPSPFDRAAVLTIDGVGEWATASIGLGEGAELTLTHELRWPDSLGLLYSAFTYHAGFRVNSGEYKLMGLAPYGQPRYADTIYQKLIDLRDDGSFTVDQRYFDYLGGFTMTNAAFSELFGGPPRPPEGTLGQREMDLAASMQQVCEEIVRRMARTAVHETGCRALCMAGGVALNAVANGKLVRERIAERLWIQPAAGDAGGALGAALLAWYRYFEAPREARGSRTSDTMHGALLGPDYSAREIGESLASLGAVSQDIGRRAVVECAAEALANGAVVGWFDGRMEFGPRALGARSILADPRDPAMQSTLNHKIKFREGFRPFAPSVLAARATEYFELDDDQESPYMLLVAPVRAGAALPAVTHRDGTARAQTVTPERAPGLCAVLEEFERRTGCAVLVNTSFNVRGEPLVCTPAEAYATFMRTDIDFLAMPPFFLAKSEQPTTRAQWERPLVLD
jgi:carbamoyltransferase